MDVVNDWRNDWHQWLEWPPPFVLIQVWRDGWVRAFTRFPHEVPGHLIGPELKWRLTGCAKMQIQKSGDI